MLPYAFIYREKKSDKNIIPAPRIQIMKQGPQQEGCYGSKDHPTPMKLFLFHTKYLSLSKQLLYNERISANIVTENIWWLLADNQMFEELCECNEHRETEGFEVSAYA